MNKSRRRILSRFILPQGDSGMRHLLLSLGHGTAASLLLLPGLASAAETQVGPRTQSVIIPADLATPADFANLLNQGPKGASVQPILQEKECYAPGKMKKRFAPCCKSCPTLPHGSMPMPVGTYLHQWNGAMAARAEADDFVIYKHEW